MTLGELVRSNDHRPLASTLELSSPLQTCGQETVNSKQKWSSIVSGANTISRSGRSCSSSSISFWRSRRRSLQISPEPALELQARSNFAFPDSQHVPAQVGKTLAAFSISRDIPGKLWMPIARICGRLLVAQSAIVLMPKAAMHEDDFPAAWKYQVRRPRQAAHVCSLS